MSSSSASTVVPVEQPRNARKKLKFEDWSDEVINLSCKEFHQYIKANNLTPEQQADLRRVRRRQQGRIAAQTCRKKKSDANAVAAAESSVVQIDVVEVAIKRARASADAVADNDVDRIFRIAEALEQEAVRLKAERDATAIAVDAILQLSGNAASALALDAL